MWDKMKYIFFKIVWAFCLAIVFFSCACQATPEEATVVNSSSLEDKIKGTPAPSGIYNAPSNWQETLDMKGTETKIKIDASISMPNVMSFPVYKVKQIEFDDTRIELLIDYFKKDKTVIEYTVPTKADLQFQLVLANKNNDAEMATEFEKMMEMAPEAVEKKKVTDWSVARSPSGCFEEEKGEYAGISVCPSLFHYTNGYIESESMVEMNDGEKIEEIALSEAGAIAIAQDMLNDLGIDYMVVDNMERAQRYVCLSSTNIYPKYSEKPVSKGYLIAFARSINGIAGIIDNGVMFNIADDFAYQAPLYPEEILVYVDEKGSVKSFVWSQPLGIEEKLTENVYLLPFENIQQRIRDMLIFINSYCGKPIKVTSIKMNMTIVNVKDHPDEGIYIPAWFIAYTRTDKKSGIQQEYTLVLNAIDGGRVLELPVDISEDIQKQMDKDE